MKVLSERGLWTSSKGYVNQLVFLALEQVAAAVS